MLAVALVAAGSFLMRSQFCKERKPMKRVLRTTPFIALALAIVLGSSGCSHSGADGPEAAGGSTAGLSSADRDAQTAALAELQKHWLKGPDGWTTAVVSGSAYAPDHFLRQCRALTVAQVESQELSESDKLNGFEWAGQATFKPTSCREGGGQAGMVLDGMGSSGPSKQPGRWSEWVDFTPGPLRFQKSKGEWQFKRDGSYLRGTLPGPQDFANAGVR
jgi:hypothetical protein